MRGTVLLVVLVLLAVAIDAQKDHRQRGGKHAVRASMGGKGKRHHKQPVPPVPTPIPAPVPVEDSETTPSQIGDRLLRTFGIFKNQPLTSDDAEAQGFSAFTDGCTPFGVGYAKGSNGPTKSDSAILYYTAGGQLAGFGSRMWGDAPQDLVEKGYWMGGVDPSDDSAYDLILSTRDSTMICSGATDGNVLGDRMFINGMMEIALNMDDAQSQGWVEGNCIPKMGVHHAYDIDYPFSQSWNFNSLVPVMPMYNPQTRALSAVLLASPDAQRIEPFGDWEGPFINMLMCKNWCANTGCTFPGVTLWTTMHWLFEDPKLNVCTGAKCVISL